MYWFNKIDNLWTQLNKSSWGDVVRLKDQIRANCMRVDVLRRENMFELDCNYDDMKVLANAKQIRIKCKKRKASTEGQLRLKNMREKIRETYARKM